MFALLWKSLHTLFEQRYEITCMKIEFENILANKATIQILNIFRKTTHLLVRSACENIILVMWDRIRN